MPAIWNEPKIECIKMERTFQFGALFMNAFILPSCNNSLDIYIIHSISISYLILKSY